MSVVLRLAAAALMLLSSAVSAQLAAVVVANHREIVAPTGPTGVRALHVGCPAGFVPLSGGVDTDYFTFIEVATLAPTFGGAELAFVPDGMRGAPDGWTANVRNYDGTAHPVSVFAVCGAVSTVTVNIASAAATSGSRSSPGNGTAFALCPAGSSAVGGGVDVSIIDTMKVSGSAPVYNGQYLIDRPAGAAGSPAGWTASVRSEGNAGALKVAVVCAQIAGVTSVSSGAFPIGSDQASGLSAQCPAGTVAIGGGIDTNNVSRNAVAVSTAMFNTNPTFPVERATGVYGAATGWYGIYYNYGPGVTTGAIGVICAPTPANVVVVYEFYNTNLRHYFRTSSAVEADAIDRGAAGPGWVRTGDIFLAYAAGSSSPGADVCRFYTFGANSHFYTASAAECTTLRAPASGWTYEGLSFRVQLPTGGTCPSGTKPVHRLYNNRFQFNDSNHRFTTLASEIPVLQAQGWLYEGIAFCAIAP